MDVAPSRECGPLHNTGPLVVNFFWSGTNPKPSWQTWLLQRGLFPLFQLYNKIWLTNIFLYTFSYSHHNYSFAATASRQGLDVSYWQRVHPQIQMANLLAWNRSTRKTIARICYQWNFWNCAVSGMIDSDALVGFTWTRFVFLFIHILIKFLYNLINFSDIWHTFHCRWALVWSWVCPQIVFYSDCDLYSIQAVWDVATKTLKKLFLFELYFLPNYQIAWCTELK